MFLLAEVREQVVGSGLSLGSAIAVVCSWQRHRSIFWAIVGGILSWIYVIYYWLTRSPDEMPRH